MDDIILRSIRDELLQNADEKTKGSAQRFFKEDAKFLGVKTPIVGKIAKKYFCEIKEREKQEIFNLCEKLLQSGYGEEAFIAFEWAYSKRNEYNPSDFLIFESWVKKYIDNWAKCDTFCNHSLGFFIEKYPEFISELKIWAKSPNRWMKRASAVTLILPARKGLFLKDAFEISDLLIEDSDDMVQKGYGWMLKEASKKHQKEVYEYIMTRKGHMPRTALRYAIEKMPDGMKHEAMKRQ